MVLAGQIWHYWLGVPLLAGSILAVVAIIVWYFRKMSSLKYPKR